MEKVVNYQDLIEKAICQIQINEEVCTSAFVIGDNYLLSAGHSFVNLRDGEKITARFLDGTKVFIQLVRCVYEPNHLKDYALFKSENGSFDKRSLPISFPKNVLGEFISMGSSNILPPFSNSQGKIIGSYYRNEEEFLFKLSSQQAGQIGFSGAPIFSIDNKSVVAIQCEATIDNIGAERDTVLAFPLIRLLEDQIVSECLFEKPIVKISSFMEKYLLPVFGKALIGLEHSDNLDAYMRCIVVKLVPEQNVRFTVFVAKTSSDTLATVIRKHHKTRKMRYGVVGGMIKANVPIIYDFKHDLCYQLDLGGTSRISNVLNDKTKGAREDRIALLVAPIRNEEGEIIGVLSFDFFPVDKEKREKDITEIINGNEKEAGRILYLSELYAQTLSQLLLGNLEMDVDFANVLPE